MKHQPDAHGRAVLIGKDGLQKQRVIIARVAVAAEHGVAQAVDYRYAVYQLVALHHMGVVPHHEVRAHVHGVGRYGFLLGGGLALIFGGPHACCVRSAGSPPRAGRPSARAGFFCAPVDRLNAEPVKPIIHAVMRPTPLHGPRQNRPRPHPPARPGYRRSLPYHSPGCGCCSGPPVPPRPAAKWWQNPPAP